jgi:hypothetical protein
MPTTLLSIGTTVTLVQNLAYALPARVTFLTASAAVEVSLDGTVWSALAGATTGVATGSNFIRSTLVNTVVICRNATIGPATQAGGDQVADSLSIGAIPALTGGIRLANLTAIKSRNAPNSADRNLIHLDVNGTIQLGEVGVGAIMGGNLSVAGIAINAGNAFSMNSLATFGNQTHFEFTEKLSAPSVPGTNRMNLWVEDNGSGKTRLMAQFNTGTAVQIAIEP